MTGPPYHGSQTHNPYGSDPNPTGRWFKSGSAGGPVFGGTWSGLVWYRLVTGAPGTTKQSFELIVKVDGGTALSTITTFPLDHLTWTDGQQIPVNGQDNAGNFRACYIDGATGDLVDGPMP